MPATVTLATTTLTNGVDSSAPAVLLASTAGISKGTRLWIDRELMEVISIGVDPWVNVLRGVDGSTASLHSSSSIVTIGRADQFYSTDPLGAPPSAIPVSPYINVISGDTWLAQGDASPAPGVSVVRWWQKVQPTYGVGALGVRSVTYEPTSST